ncbi:MAG: hypothetical protein IKX62_02365 [Bacteroidales bacterium]|nr:hypothetical protein [Bacteroidales bacterium]
MFQLSRSLALLLSVVLLLAACGSASRRHIAATLDDVETYINDRPDSALAVLEGVDSTALITRALRARYSLLHVMALDKCYKDITAPGLLDEASKWYEHHGTADEKVKTLYYQGRIEQGRNDLSSAAVFFSKAEQLVEKVQDKHAIGLLYEAMASVYNSAYNADKEKEYYEKAILTFEQSGDPMYKSALGGLALVYHTRKEWTKADSLYQEAIKYSEPYHHALTVYLSNYARMKLLQPDKDPAGAIELLDQKRTMTGGGLTPQEAGAYAYASELLGEKAVTDKLVPRLQSLSEDYPTDVLPWLSRIAIVRGDFELAYQYQTEAHLRETAVVQDALTDTVTQALREDADLRAQVSHSRLLWMGSLASAICFALFSLVLLGIIRRHKLEEERNRLISVREQLQAELESSEQEICGQQDRIREMEEKVALERETYTRERVIRLRQLGELRSTFWWRERGGMRESEALKKIKEEIAYVFQTDNNGIVLVRRLDRELDGAVSRLRKELHLRGNPREVLFLCCCILDLEPELIAEVMGITKANVYEKRSRLRARIRNLGDPLLSVLVEKTK